MQKVKSWLEILERLSHFQWTLFWFWPHLFYFTVGVRLKWKHKSWERAEWIQYCFNALIVKQKIIDIFSNLSINISLQTFICYPRTALNWWVNFCIPVNILQLANFVPNHWQQYNLSSGATVCTTQWNKIQSCYTSCML